MSSEGRFIADVLIGISGTLWIYKRNYSFTQLLLPHVQWILTNNKWGRSFCFAGKSECACSSVKQTESDVVLGEQSGVWQFYRRFSVFMLDFSARTCRLAFLPAAGKWCSWAVFADYLKNIHRLCESLEMLEIYRHCYKRLRRWQLNAAFAHLVYLTLRQWFSWLPVFVGPQSGMVVWWLSRQGRAREWARVEKTCDAHLHIYRETCVFASQKTLAEW